jgi:hypothetical protein
VAIRRLAGRSDHHVLTGADGNAQREYLEKHATPKPEVTRPLRRFHRHRSKRFQLFDEVALPRLAQIQAEDVL